MSENKVKILEAGDYSIYIGDILKHLTDWLTEKKHSGVFILVDENTRQHCLPILQLIPPAANANVIEIQAGEKYKTIETTSLIWGKLMEAHADRNALLINIGGGVITDIGGFAAATFKRGIDFINLPTTLLAMVDASVGGKTGVDFNGVKNAVGLITNPKAVFVHPAFLQTLPHEQLLSGYAEMIKHSLIAGNTGQMLAFSPTTADELTADRIAASINVKLSIVVQDINEKGIRKQLNFGHTVGHALESWLLQKKRPALHGICVAAGMVVELYLSEKMAGLEATEKNKMVKQIDQVLPDIAFTEKDIPDIIALMKQDKKNADGRIGFVLLQKPGVALIDQFVDEALIAQALKYYLKAIS